MLRIISGPARSGKTHILLNEIKNSSRSGLILITPEQASHKAERMLASCCGASINLRAEVLSFTRLAGRVFTELGGSAEVLPDKNTKLLLMSLAVSSVSPELKLYSSREKMVDFLESLLNTREELAGNMISPDRLAEVSRRAEGAVSDKLFDLSLICGAYDVLLSERLSDPRERLERLSELIPQSSIGSGGVYIDGFTDFTALEMQVIDAFLRRGTDITVSLCRTGSEGYHFAVADMTFSRLCSMARERGTSVITDTADYIDASRHKAITALCENLYGSSAPEAVNAEGRLEAVSAESIFSECELAAGRILSWMKENPALRWGDIAVAARSFDRYESIARSVFELYGIPFYTDRQEHISHSGVFALTLSALAAVSGSWRREDIFRCLKTGLTELAPDEIGALENYCLTWTIRGESSWKREWKMNPRGYVPEYSESDNEALKKINELREKVYYPLSVLSEKYRNVKTAADFALAVYGYFEALGLEQRLSEKALILRSEGKDGAAELLSGSWELMVSSLEQFFSLLSSNPTDGSECMRLFSLLSSRLTVGSIPAALDSVSLGELSRLRGECYKRLIVLGAGDSELPMISSSGGVFSRDERLILSELGLELSVVEDEELCREFYLIYSALSSASDGLYMSWQVSSSPCFVINRMKEICGVSPVFGTALLSEAASQASEPLFRLALSGDSSEQAECARSIASELWGNRYESAVEAVNAPRGSLGEVSVRELYGNDFRVTASKVEKFSVCRFSYFMSFGLRAKKPAVSVIDAPEFGNFIHYVLEHTASEANEHGGFRKLGREESAKLAQKHIENYIREKMHGFEGKSSRFIYLFTRLKKTALEIVRSVADEFEASEFTPYDFELNFDFGKSVKPMQIDCDGFKLTVNGKVDRVDGWVKDDTLYLRVADYKTGSTTFSLSDIRYGKGMQMLIYLFALQENGGNKYENNNIVPAGVLYSPAREVILSMPKESSDEEISRERLKSLKHTGLILNDPDVIEAMESGEAPKIIPVTFKDGTVSGSLASAEQLGRLSEYIKHILREMGREVKAGSIQANPLKNAAEDPCAYCEFAAACDFREDVDKARIKEKLPDNEFWECISSI